MCTYFLNLITIGNAMITVIDFELYLFTPVALVGLKHFRSVTFPILQTSFSKYTLYYLFIVCPPRNSHSK